MKKILAMMLTVVLLVAVLTVTSSAAGSQGHSHGICGATACSGHNWNTYSPCAAVGFQKILNPQTLETCTIKDINGNTTRTAYSLPAGNYYLNEAVTFDKPLAVTSGTVQICLNGYDLNLNSADGMLRVEPSARLNITDCSSGVRYGY